MKPQWVTVLARARICTDSKYCHPGCSMMLPKSSVHPELRGRSFARKVKRCLFVCTRGGKFEPLEQRGILFVRTDSCLAAERQARDQLAAWLSQDSKPKARAGKAGGR